LVRTLKGFYKIYIARIIFVKPLQGFEGDGTAISQGGASLALG
jgi:hypothetical protein